MGKRFKSYCLILVSMVMLAALVIPHHHHGDRMCMKPRQEMSSEKDCSDNHSKEKEHDDFCKISCASQIRLNKVDCDQNLLPACSSFVLILNLFDDLLLQEEYGKSSRQEIYYHEKLYPQCLSAVRGLRAPPVQYSFMIG